ncbi:hypothetical protein F5Y03DRAFT_358088 [Xylaria venustula]|nr:hypothetical protein F5Y03DRAFT_358088 [Xylaria venustula]
MNEWMVFSSPSLCAAVLGLCFDNANFGLYLARRLQTKTSQKKPKRWLGRLTQSQQGMTLVYETTRGRAIVLLMKDHSLYMNIDDPASRYLTAAYTSDCTRCRATPRRGNRDLVELGNEGIVCSRTVRETENNLELLFTTVPTCSSVPI